MLPGHPRAAVTLNIFALKRYHEPVIFSGKARMDSVSRKPKKALSTSRICVSKCL